MRKILRGLCAVAFVCVLLVPEDLLEKVKGLVEKFWQQGVKVFEDCRVSAKS